MDTTPGSRPIDEEDATLGVGRTFTDPFTGVSVTTLALSPSGATVAIVPAADQGGQGDADGDGTCDVGDLCSATTPGQLWDRAALTLRNVGDGVPGNDALKIRARFTLATGSFSVDPMADGARLELRSGSGTPKLDVTLPGGAFVPPGPGWTALGNGYRFRDGRSGGTGGITKVRVKDRGGGTVDVSISGTRGTFAVGAGDLPLQATLRLGDTAAGECGEIAFGPGACAARGTSVFCR